MLLNLQQLDAKHKLFARSQTVVDLASSSYPERLQKSDKTDNETQGYAPGSWSQASQYNSIDIVCFLALVAKKLTLQVAVERTRPHGLVIGIDLIPAQPPRGVNTIQGDFLSPAVQRLVKNFVLESHRRQRPAIAPPEEDAVVERSDLERPSYVDMERHASHNAEAQVDADNPLLYRVVDVCLANGLPPSLSLTLTYTRLTLTRLF